MPTPNIPRSIGSEGGEAPATIAGAFPMGVYRAAPAALADGDAGPILLDSAGGVVISGASPVSGGYFTTEIAANALGQNLVIAAPAVGSFLAIRKISFIVASAVNVIFYRANASGTVFTPISGTYTFGANGGMALDLDNYPMTCGDNERFYINLSAAVLCGGMLMYTVETT